MTKFKLLFMSSFSLPIVITIATVTIIPIYGVIITSASIIWPVTTLLFTWLLIGLRQPHKSIRFYSVLLFLIFFHTINIAYFISYYLQDAGFNQAFFYHFSPDIIFADIGNYTLMIIFVFFQYLFLTVFSIKALNNGQEGKLKFFQFHVVLYLFFLVITLYYCPPIHELVSSIDNSFLYEWKCIKHFDHDKSFEDFLNRDQLSVYGAKRAKNFIFIYLESLEQTYFDQTVFPGLLPGLTELKRHSVVFQDVFPYPGMSWTMAGMVASQCGVPLNVPFKRLDPASIGIFEGFMPRAVCLGDDLSSTGYFLVFMGGADLRFGGKGSFYWDHGFSEVYGRQELSITLPAGTPQSWWGIYDNSLLALAYNKFLSLSQENMKFGLVLLTLDTHHPDGYPSPGCDKYSYIDNKILHAVHCTDQLVSKFVAKVRNSKYSNETIIFLLSDHLAQRNTASNLLKSTGKKRKLTFFVNYPDGRDSINTNKGTSLDISATVMDILGVEENGELLGFGRSLVKQDGYLSDPFHDIRVLSSRSFYEYVKSLWKEKKNVSISSGIEINLKTLSVTIGDSIYNIRRWGSLDKLAPTVFKFDGNKYALTDLYSYSRLEIIPKDGLTTLVTSNSQSIYLVISPAKYLHGLIGKQSEQENNVYVLLGRFNDLFSLPLRNGKISLSRSKIRKVLNL